MDINTEQSQSNGGTIANEKRKSNYNSEIIQDSPFKIIYEEEIGYYVVMGTTMITEPCETKEEAIEKLPTYDLKTLFTIIAAIAEQTLMLLNEATPEELEARKENFKKILGGYTNVN